MRCLCVLTATYYSAAAIPQEISLCTNQRLWAKNQSSGFFHPYVTCSIKKIYFLFLAIVTFSSYCSRWTVSLALHIQCLCKLQNIAFTKAPSECWYLSARHDSRSELVSALLGRNYAGNVPHFLRLHFRPSFTNHITLSLFLSFSSSSNAFYFFIPAIAFLFCVIQWNIIKFYCKEVIFFKSITLFGGNVNKMWLLTLCYFSIL